MTEENENINNKYLDIVDDSILGHGATVADNINAILRDKIGIEIDDYKKEFANDMFHGDDEEYEIETAESEEGIESDSEEEETENEEA
jgi:hypothetical protein